MQTQNGPCLHQFTRYAMVGAIAFSADFGLLFVIAQFLKANYLLSAVIGFSAGVIINYILCTLWVFPKRTIENRLLEFLVFVSIGLIGLGINEITMWFLTERISIHYLLSKANAVIIVFFWNFFARKAALFR
jgi:putative flippase GtrA